MAYPDDVNNQITDAITQTNLKVIGESPAIALGSLYQTAAHSTGIMFENAVNTQHQTNLNVQAATTSGVITLYSIDTVADAAAVKKMPEDLEK